MGHRALIAYERPDSRYNLHYSHWGASKLRLKHAITQATPFGGTTPDQRLQTTHRNLLEATDDRGIETALDGIEVPSQDIDVQPWDVQIRLDTILSESLDYLHHEALYVVDTDFEVTAYRTHWFGLQYDCRTVEQAPTHGNGALRTVRWYDGQRVDDGFTQGEFRALKNVTGDMVDRGVFTPAEATEYLTEKLVEWVDEDQELVVRRPNREPETEGRGEHFRSKRE